MNTVWVLARMTLKESVRRKIAIASLVLGVAFLLVFNLGFHYIIADLVHSTNSSTRAQIYIAQGYNFMHLAAMYATNFLAIVFATLITADSLSGEITSGTVQVTAAKPIRRWQIVLGKWLGNAILLAGYILLLAGGAVLGIWIQSGYVAPACLAGVVLLYLNGLLVMTLTLAFSSAFSTLATGGTVFGLFGIAFIGGWVERFGNALDNQTAVNIGVLSSLVMPSEAIWNLASNLMTNPLASTLGASPFSFGSQPSPLMVAYTFVYLAACLAYAIHHFQTRDL